MKTGESPRVSDPEGARAYHVSFQRRDGSGHVTCLLGAVLRTRMTVSRREALVPSFRPQRLVPKAYAPVDYVLKLIRPPGRAGEAGEALYLEERRGGEG